MASDYTIAADSSVYYRGRYWNDLDRVRAHLNRRATGSESVSWYAHLLSHNGGRPFHRALILNCGNGWVEHDLLAAGTIESAVGIDISEPLLADARAAADARQLRYVRMDINTVAFPDDDFDLAVNHAAGHHIAYPDRVLRALADRLGPDGTFASWDYVGPHRNQYRAGAWEAAWSANRDLPERFRMDLRYPHLPTMVADDPTEAIHSELFRSHLDRYFVVEHERALGGAIAYLLLTFNDAIHLAYAQGDPEADATLRRILELDEAYTDEHPEDTLFWYGIAKPRAEQPDRGTLDEWERAENEREQRASVNGGVYYGPTYVAAVSQERLDADPIARRRAAAGTAIKSFVGRVPGAQVAFRNPRLRRIRQSWGSSRGGSC